MGTKELIDKKLIWKIDSGKWCFLCKKCGRLKEYKDERSATVGFRKSNGCTKCMITDEYRRKSGMGLRIALRGRKIGPPSKETREKIRQAHLNRNRCIDHAATVDDGADEWFSSINNLGFYFVQNCQFPPMSYRIDGYDAFHHIVVEYDTLYHKRYKIVERDKNKQEDVIKYWEKKGKPLRQFIRIDVKKGMTTTAVIVYQDGQRKNTALKIPFTKKSDLVK